MVAALPESVEVEGKTNDVEGCFARTSLFLRKEKGLLSAVFGDVVVELVAACSGCLGGSAGKFGLGAAAGVVVMVVVAGWPKEEKGLSVVAGSAGLPKPPNTLVVVVELAGCEDWALPKADSWLVVPVLDVALNWGVPDVVGKLKIDEATVPVDGAAVVDAAEGALKNDGVVVEGAPKTDLVSSGDFWLTNRLSGLPSSSIDPAGFSDISS